MNERRYWELSLTLPILVPAIVFAVTAAVRPLSPNSVANPIFSVVAFYLMASVPFGLPVYLPMAVAALVMLRRRGPGWFRRWLWVAPIAYSALFMPLYAFMLGTETAVWSLLVVLAVGYFYVATAWIGYRWIAHRAVVQV